MIDIFSVYQVYFTAAALGAHSNFVEEGFRQKDVRFLLGLFLNWVDATTKGVDEKIHNTQISRYLKGLEKAGFAKRSQSGGAPRYHLTRSGLLELVGQLSKAPQNAPMEQFFFVFYFMKNYGSRLTELVAQKENRLPRPFQVELEALLDSKELLDQQIRHVKLEIRKLEGRIQETKGAAALSAEMSAKGVSSEEMIKAVEQMYPYEMNSQKSMSELFREIPANLRIWELTVGNESRMNILWSGMKDYMMGYLQALSKLKS